MRQMKAIILVALVGLMVPVGGRAQDVPKDTSPDVPAHGVAEAGSRGVWGDVYGRPDLPFTPTLSTSKYGEYRDLRDGFFLRSLRATFDSLSRTKYYLDLQSDRAIFHDQSYLATFGKWDRFQLQFRYDEIPHTYSNTTRTPYVETRNGVLTVSPLLRSTLATLSATAPTTLPGTIQTQIVPGLSFIVPALERRAGTLSFIYEFDEHWDVRASFNRERATGSRPLALLFNSSPSASVTGGYGTEVPEPINYFNNTVNVIAEQRRERWGMQLDYVGSFFQNSTSTLTFDNPFLVADCVAPTNCTAATQGPAKGEVDHYPANNAQYVSAAGTVELAKQTHAVASVNAGWLHQDAPLVPYTTNSLLEPQTAALPAPSLHGEKQTLAMNYKLIQSLGKNLDIKFGYRQYDYNNNTPVLSLTPVEGDISAPNVAAPTNNTPFGYNRKNIEVTANWYFAPKSSVKAGYQGEVVDRTNRDVAHSLENGFTAAIDSSLRRDLSYRVSYEYADRNPDHYVDPNALITSGGITNDSVYGRRFDEAARLHSRGDAELEYSPTDRLSFSGFAGTTQDNYNRRGGVNSPSALNYTTSVAAPYYLYGVLKDLSYNAGFDGDFTLTNSVSLFVDYSYERYYKSMASRYRAPGGATPTPLDCSTAGHGCDSPNNDWGSTAADHVHIVSLGWDLHPSKKAFITSYYSLSAAKGNVDSFALGDPTVTTGPDKFLLTGTNVAVNYPETTSRNHEVVAIFKYNLTKNLTPKVEYRYQQYDNLDYQTSPMTPYMGCVSPLPPGTAVPGCPSVLIGTASQYYPYSVVGDTSAARFLFMGADQPSYRAHYLAASMEYRF